MTAKRVVVITGASAGIGRATAARLARDGDALVICARRADRLDAVAAEIAAAGGQALPIVADVTRAEDMDMLAARAVERFGRLDVMMCNAGFGIAGAIDDVAPDQMQKLMVTRAFGPRQSVDTVADAIARAIRRPVPRSLSALQLARARDPQRGCSRLLRSDRAALRAQASEEVTEMTEVTETEVTEGTGSHRETEQQRNFVKNGNVSPLLRCSV